MQTQTTFYRLKIVSPLHIGCDEVYEPTSFAIDEKKEELINFDAFEFLAKLSESDRDTFSAICQKGTISSLLEIYKFIKLHADQAEGERVGLCAELVEHYKSTLSLPANEIGINRALNNFLINRTSFNALTELPYVPGSAIKGSIRTAVLNLRNGGREQPVFPDARKLQENLLGFQFNKLESDPFRMVKVSDFLPIGEAKRRIVYAVNHKKNPSKFEAKGPPQILEIVEPGAEFVGAITVTDPERTAGINKPIAMQELRKALHLFYQSEKSREDQELKGIGIAPVAMETSDSVQSLRLGRHSGAECVTVLGHRKIKIMQGGGNQAKEKDHATTVWLAANSKKRALNTSLRSFGWVTLEEIPETEWRTLLGQADQVAGKRFARLSEQVEQKKADEAIRSARLAQEQAKQTQKEAEEKLRHEQLAGLQSSWDAMSEQERDFASIRKDESALRFAANDASDPNQNIWKKIDTAAPDHQKALAAAFMERWQTEKSWSKKECSKKQFEKVQKIKAILCIS